LRRGAETEGLLGCGDTIPVLQAAVMGENHAYKAKLTGNAFEL
jgi:hypothetical protein